VDWRPAVGDPTVLGWFTAVLCAVAGALCWFAAGTAGVRGTPRVRTVWRVVGAALLALAVNKQLDLQELVREAGRELVRAAGWDAHRRGLQAGFWCVAAACATAVAAFVVHGLRGVVRQHATLLAGVVVTLAFVLVRSAGIEHVGERTEARIEASGLLRAAENAGPALIGAAAAARLRKGSGDGNPRSASGKTRIPS
jgi:hypothetical protein